MNKSIKVISTVVMSLLSISVMADNVPEQSDDMVQKTITSFMSKNNIPGVAVELYSDGKLSEYYFGYANQEKKDPVSRKTIFEIGSVSKVMTSLLLAQEVDWAKMSFSDPVTKYLTNLPSSYKKIRLQDLATHTSGLPFDLPAGTTTTDEMNEFLDSYSPESDPGDEWTYSSLGIGLLGKSLEKSTERDFDDLYRRHVLNPLKMVTGVAVPKSLEKYYAQGYDRKGEPAPRINPGLLPAAGAVKASAADMQRFLSAAIGLPGTPPRVFYPMRMTQSVYVKMGDDYQGLGWQIHKIESGDIPALLKVPDANDLGPVQVQEIYSRPPYNGDALIDKTGSTNGFRAYIAVIPNKKSGIVILTNKNVPNSAIVKTAREILFKSANMMS